MKNNAGNYASNTIVSHKTRLQTTQMIFVSHLPTPQNMEREHTDFPKFCNSAIKNLLSNVQLNVNTTTQILVEFKTRSTKNIYRDNSTSPCIITLPRD